MTCAHHLEDTFRRVVAADSVAAVIAEPVLGEGGFVVPPKEFFPTIREICDKYGIVFIADEVQSGIGRTGKMFAIEHFGVEPDLITMAKSLGGGLPIGAVTGRSEIMDAPQPGGLGSTFAGNPLACVAALAALETIEKDGLLARSTAIGKRFEERARDWQRKWPLIGEIRGLGGARSTNAPACRHGNQGTRQILLRAWTDHHYCGHVQQRHAHPRTVGDYRCPTRRRSRCY
jgi:4-aminobutyrate aminotransferase/(S)-3-amino-2-methylpropionate transaminase